MTKEQKSDILLATEKVKSTKEFIIADEKIEGFCLNPEKKHWKDFYETGYTENSGKLLREQLKNAFESGERIEVEIVNKNIKFAIYCKLGVTKEKRFCTAWQIDSNSEAARFISAYRKDR